MIEYRPATITKRTHHTEKTKLQLKLKTAFDQTLFVPSFEPVTSSN